MSRSRVLLASVLLLGAGALPQLGQTALSRSAVDDHPTPASLLITTDADTVFHPGVNIGITSYDMQHHDSQGHQIATNPGSNTVHFAWTEWDIVPSEIQARDRFVSYNSWDKLSGSAHSFNGTRVSLGEIAHSGFVRLDVDHENLCHATFHQSFEQDYPPWVWRLYFPIEGSPLHLDVALSKSPTHPDETEYLWPDVAVAQNLPLTSENRDVVHVISSGALDIGGGYPVPSDHIWYWRYDASAPVPVWEGPALLDSSEALSWVIDAANNSEDVAIAFTSDYAYEGLNGVNNVAYRESHSAGAAWIDGTETGDAYKNLITGYSDTLAPCAGREVSVAYDNRGVLHIVFLEQRTSDRDDHVSLKHWSDELSSVHTITQAHYDNPGTWMRAGNIAQISFGVGDGATSCWGGTTTNEDYLYTLFTKLGGESPEEQADTSTRGFANGELYLSVSSDHGLSWSVPFNLTQTKSPECSSDNPATVCASEAWATIARDVGDIEILFIRDFEAGSYQESPWALNRVVYYRIPGGSVDAEYLCPEQSCVCACLGDPRCDGQVNVLDVVDVVNVAFRGFPAFVPTACSYAATDLDCSDATNVMDVVHVVNVAFRGGDPQAEFCDPCAP